MNRSYLSRPRYSFRFVMFIIAGVSSAIAAVSSFAGGRSLALLFFGNAVLFFALAYQEDRNTRFPVDSRYCQ